MTNTDKFIAKYGNMIKPLKYAVNEGSVLIACPKGITQEDMLEDGYLGNYFVNEGFVVTFSTGDFEYTTKPACYNYRGAGYFKGHKAYLRNRLIMTIK